MSLIQDSEYIEEESLRIYMAFEPLAGKLHQPRRRSPSQDGQEGATLLDSNEYGAIVALVEINPERAPSLHFYEVYEPAVAKAHLDRLEFCLYAQSWLMHWIWLKSRWVYWTG